ncbi:MAG: hypothetical protein WC700_19010 [Gemmatimonadaceae bacterium]|jgi:hypothetical protein
MKRISGGQMVKLVNGRPAIVVHRALRLVIMSAFDGDGRRTEDRFYDFAMRPRRFGEAQAFGVRYDYAAERVTAYHFIKEDP